MVPSNRCHIENQKTLFVIEQLSNLVQIGLVGHVNSVSKQIWNLRIRQDTALDTECSPAEQDLRQNDKFDIWAVKFFLPFNGRRFYSHVQSGLKWKKFQVYLTWQQPCFHENYWKYIFFLLKGVNKSHKWKHFDPEKLNQNKSREIYIWPFLNIRLRWSIGIL